MSYTLIAVLVVPLVLAALSGYLSACAQNGQSQANQQSVFRVAPFVFFFCLVLAVMGAILGLSTLNDDRPRNAIVMIVSVSGCSVLGALVAIWWYAKCAIRLTEDEVILETPRSRTAVRFDQLKDVRVASGMIILDEGKVPRVVVPIIYRNSALLVANIEARRFNPKIRSQ